MSKLTNYFEQLTIKMHFPRQFVEPLHGLIPKYHMWSLYYFVLTITKIIGKAKPSSHNMHLIC